MKSSQTAVDLRLITMYQIFIQDYPDCGIRNNDTFTLPSNFVEFANESTADWSAECLWDCTWKDNPYVGRTYLYDDTLPVNITISMPKVGFQYCQNFKHFNTLSISMQDHTLYFSFHFSLL
jgi:hypothetical protein